MITPAWLLYATGGIAWQGIDIDGGCGGNSFCSSAHNETVSTTQAGWTLGAGLEVMLRRNWLVRLEYRFSDYGRLDHTFFLGSPADRVGMSESLTTQTLLVGFSYKLNGQAPVNPRSSLSIVDPTASGENGRLRLRLVNAGARRGNLVRHALLHEGTLLLQVELERLLFAILGAARDRRGIGSLRLVPDGIVVRIDLH